MNIRVDGIHKRREEATSTGGTHLVFVIMNMGKPIMEQYSRASFRFGQVDRNPVAVVIVTGIVVVKPGHPPSLVFSAQIFSVPVNYHLLAVRISRWHE